MYPELIKKLVKSLSGLPGLSERAATRYVFYFLKKPAKDIEDLAKNLIRLKRDIVLCSRCYNIAQKTEDKTGALCVICQDKKRVETEICLVEKISDIERIESMHFYNGVYHVLGGLLNPIKGITPQKITFNRLINRLKKFKKNNKNPELIIALNPTREGDLTVNYLKELIAPLKIKITRLARGIPTGGEIQYADEDTLKESFSQRKKL